MGVPKFFRWLSNKYPNINLMVDEVHVPEFDNLYLDMNGIIHRCSHPSDNPEDNSNMSESEIFLEVFRYLDQLFQIIKPKKYLFLAIDGPAPRAKMNQQRSRRFRAGKATEIARNRPHSSHFPKDLFDSNCITPGTEFMEKLSSHIEFFIQKKINDDPLWRIPKIIYSSHLVPGEGEHKIMDFIREYKLHPEYDPNTRHCIYGLDADLIMLGLASHEPHFALLREVIHNQGPRRGNRSQKPKTASEGESGDQFHLLHLSILRDYIAFDIGSAILNFQWDKERVIDDIILLFMFVGNDFLPHLPQFDIAHGTLELLFYVYPIYLVEEGEYLQDSGEINLRGLATFFQKLPALEERFKMETSSKSKSKKPQKGQDDESDEDEDGDGEEGPPTTSSAPDPSRIAYYEGRFQQTYYEDPNFVEKLCLEYARGLCWVSRYYYQGCPSWDWYFPYHYAPLASDMSRIPTNPIAFEIGVPVLPFKQLLAVLPPFSSRLLPAPYQKLMCDPNSPLAIYYPKDFEVDMTGVKNEWEGVVIIPFIDWQLFSDIVDEIPVSLLSNAEKGRNVVGTDRAYFHDPSANVRAVSPLPGLFRDIEGGRVNVRDYSHARIPVGYVWRSALHPQTSNRMDGFPTLLEHDCTAARSIKPQSGRNRGPMPTILNITRGELQCTSEIADALLGKYAMIGWPHSAQGKILSYSDGVVQSNWDDSSKSIRRFPMNPDQITKFESEVKRTQTNLETKQAIKIDQIGFLFTIRYSCGYKMGSDGLSIGGLSEDNIYVPFSLIRGATAQDDVTLLQNGSTNLAVNDLAVYTNLENRRYVGARVKIVRIQNEICDVEIESNTFVDRGELQRELDKYHTSQAVCRNLKIPFKLLSKITSSIRANPGNVEIGLGIKFNGKELQLNGYAEKEMESGDNPPEWVYSDAALDLLFQYLNRVRPIVRILESTQDYCIDITPALGTRSEEFLTELNGWISSLPFKRIPLQRCGSFGTSINRCKAINSLVQERLLQSRQSPPERLLNVERKHLATSRNLVPGNIIRSIDVYQLADRVVYVGTGAIPFGSWGTVVSTNPTSSTIEIIFDENFVGGTSLHGRCELAQGSEKNVDALVNVTYLRYLKNQQHPMTTQAKPPLQWAPPPKGPLPWNRSGHHASPKASPTYPSSQLRVSPSPTTAAVVIASPTPPTPNSVVPKGSSPQPQNPRNQTAAHTIIIKTRDSPQPPLSSSLQSSTNVQPLTTPGQGKLEVLSQQLQSILQIGSPQQNPSTICDEKK